MHGPTFFFFLKELPILILYDKPCDTQKCDAPNEVLENNHEI